MECRHTFTMCRLCLCESESLIGIFQVNERFGYVAAEVIRDLLQFQVSEADGYPHAVCSICLGKLTDFKQFKQKCLDSRDTYNNVFACEESDTEHPIDIEELRPVKMEAKDALDTQGAQKEAVLDPASPEEEETITDDIPPQVELRPVKLEPKDPLDTQEGQEEVTRRSIAFTSLEYLSQKRTRCKTYEPYENRSGSVNNGGKASLKGREKVTVEANTCENIQSSGSAEVKVGKMDVKVRRGDRKSPGDINRAELSVQELRKEVIERREEVNRVDTSVDSTLKDEETITFTIECDSDTGGGSEREGGEEVPVGENEREGEKEHFKCNDCGKDFPKKDVLIRHLELHGYEVNNESSSEEKEFQVNANDYCGTTLNMNEVRKKGLKRRSDKVKRGEEVKKYVCDLCNKGFNWKSHLKIHLRVHTGEKPFACSVCDKRFSYKSYLSSHKLTHTGEKPFVCKVCRKGFTQNQSLITHMRIHTGEKPYVCQVCHKCFAVSSSLTVHLRRHSREKPYECGVCNKRFTDSSSLRQHSIVHSQEKPCSCEVCKKCFSDSCSLKKHSRIHSTEKPYSCRACGKRFADSFSLKKHFRTHTEEKPYACPICKKGFSNSSSQIRHSRIHSQDKPYKCQECSKCFVDSSSLRKHLRVHSREKPYVCKVCEKCFSVRSTLTRHLRIHTKEKPYACHVCNRCFRYSSNLTSHLRIHSQEKP